MKSPTEFTGLQAILVAIDLSESARDVLAFAAEMAGGRARPMVVLHVVNGSSGEADARPSAAPRTPSMCMTDLARERLQALLEQVADQGPDPETLREARLVLVDGVPAPRILEVAKREDAAMIVMGSHGRCGVDRVVNGSVAESVTRKSPIPVTVVKAGGAGEEGALHS